MEKVIAGLTPLRSLFNRVEVRSASEESEMCRPSSILVKEKCHVSIIVDTPSHAPCLSTSPLHPSYKN